MVCSFSLSRRLRGFFRFALFLLSLVLFVALGINVTSSSALSTAVNDESVQLAQSRAVFAIPVVEQTAKANAHIAIPTISILSVDVGNSVTFRTSNYPANQQFKVLMGKMGSRGINGIEAGGFNSGNGGSFDLTFDIPDSLQDASLVAIRTQTSHPYPYYSFNWFSNMKAPEPTPIVNSTGDDEAENTAVTAVAVYTGTPTFKVCQVSQNNSVTIATSKLPPNQTFTVRMGAFGTAGIGGVVAGTFESGSGEALNVSMNIPASLQGYGRIALRIQTAHAQPYYAYNWFYNNTASVC